MHIKHLKIDDFNGIRDLFVRFEDDDGKPNPCTAIVGPRAGDVLATLTPDVSWKPGLTVHLETSPTARRFYSADRDMDDPFQRIGIRSPTVSKVVRSLVPDTDYKGHAFVYRGAKTDWGALPLSHRAILTLGLSIAYWKPGVALIEEVDLHIPPAMQVTLLERLTQVFPAVQFIVTTNSPFALMPLKAREVATLVEDGTGNLSVQPNDRDPRLRTVTELAEMFFGIDRLYPTELGNMLDTYSHIAIDPRRSDREHAVAKKLHKQLLSAGIKPGIPLCKRKT